MTNAPVMWKNEGPPMARDWLLCSRFKTSHCWSSNDWAPPESPPDGPRSPAAGSLFWLWTVQYTGDKAQKNMQEENRPWLLLTYVQTWHKPRHSHTQSSFGAQRHSPALQWSQSLQFFGTQVPWLQELWPQMGFVFWAMSLVHRPSLLGSGSFHLMEVGFRLARHP